MQIVKFKFNLILPKSEEEIIKIEERDNTILYSFVLIFASALIYFILTIIHGFFIEQRIDSQKDLIKTNEARIASYDGLKIINGELILKSKVLEPIIKSDIDPIALIDVSENLLELEPQIKIEQFQRETDGSFTFIINTDEFEDTTDIITSLRSIENVSNVFIKQIIDKEGANNQNVIALTITFNIEKNG